jgi:hypothetical protein
MKLRATSHAAPVAQKGKNGVMGQLRTAKKQS